jgi:hypothetical protein
MIRGYVLNSLVLPHGKSVPVISTYHPSFAARGKSNILPVMKHDLNAALKLAMANGKYKKPPRDYILYPPVEELRKFYNEALLHPDWPIYFDIETRESMEDDESELRALGGGRIARIQTTDWDTNPESAEVWDWLDQEKMLKGEEKGAGSYVTVTRIEQIQFCFRAGEAIVVPFEGDYVEVCKQIMGLRNDKVGWNSWTFDDPLLAEAGVVSPWLGIDAMWAWHHFHPDLPRGLQYACSFWGKEYGVWKHTSQSDPGMYGGADVDQLARMWVPLRKLMEESRGMDGVRGRNWESYQRHVRGLWPALVSSGNEGIPINEERLKELGEEVDRESDKLFGKLQKEYPVELKGVTPKSGYVNDTVAEKVRNKEGEGLEKGERWERRWFEVEVKRWVKDLEEGELERVCKENEGVVGRDEGKEKDGERVEGKAWVKYKVEVERWCKVKAFLPNSSQQILRYMKFMKHPVPKDLKTKKETSGKDELKKLARKFSCDFYLKIIEFRELKKIKGTYVDGWKPGEDGRVHTTWTFAPATGQLSSRSPNVQNSPKRHTLAKAFRRCVEADEDKVLIEADYRAFHVLTTGFESGCWEYMELSRLDMHSFFAGHLLKLPGHEKWFDMLRDEGQRGELREVLKWVKKKHKGTRNGKAKPSILGVGFGLGAYKLYFMNEGSFTGVGETRQVMGRLKGLFPKVFEWQNEVRKEAYKAWQANQPLVTRYGFQRWFPDVYHYQQVPAHYSGREEVFTGEDGKKYIIRWGADSEKAIAYRPSNDAFEHKKDALLMLSQMEKDKYPLGLLGKYGYVNDIHDAFLFHCPKKYADECAWTAKHVMEYKNPMLVGELAKDGLWCQVEVEVGKSWAEMEEIKFE